MMNKMCMEWLMISSQQGSEGSMYIYMVMDGCE